MAPGRARYTMICAANGGVLDDLIVYRLADQEFLIVANASNTAVVDRRFVSEPTAMTCGSWTRPTATR